MLFRSREVCNLVRNGVCTIEDADKAVTYGPGLRWAIMGPSLVFELGGGEGHKMCIRDRS